MSLARFQQSGFNFRVVRGDDRIYCWTVYVLVVSFAHIVSSTLGHGWKAEGEAGQTLARQAFDLALLAQNMLKGEALTAFVKRSADLLAAE